MTENIYGRMKDFNEAFAKVLSNWGYEEAAAAVKKLQISAHLLWIRDGSHKYFRSLPGRRLTPTAETVLDDAFYGGLEDVLELQETKKPTNRLMRVRYAHPRDASYSGGYVRMPHRQHTPMRGL